jgi:hypothetical protein
MRPNGFRARRFAAPRNDDHVVRLMLPAGRSSRRCHELWRAYGAFLASVVFKSFTLIAVFPFLPPAE